DGGGTRQGGAGTGTFARGEPVGELQWRSRGDDGGCHPDTGRWRWRGPGCDATDTTATGAGCRSGGRRARAGSGGEVHSAAGRGPRQLGGGGGHRRLHGRGGHVVLGGDVGDQPDHPLVGPPLLLLVLLVADQAADQRARGPADQPDPCTFEELV